MKNIFTKFIIFIIGIVIGVSINVMFASPKVNNTENVNSSIRTETVFINGTRYTVVTSSASSMVILR